MAAGPGRWRAAIAGARHASAAYGRTRDALEPLIRLAAAWTGGNPDQRRKFTVSVFSDKELDYLAGKRLGRLATIDANGLPHIVPLGWSYNPALDTIDVGGRDFARTKKFRNVRANSKVALVIDDVVPPWRPRCVMVRGQAEALEEATSADGEQLGPIIRIHPGQVISWGLDGAET
jgi:pyridoxamine 5'-phosphate oxidase family protein